MNTDVLIKQLEGLINEYDQIIEKSKHDDGSDIITDTSVAQYIVQALAAIERIVGRNSIYYEQANKLLEKSYSCYILKQIIGIAKSLYADIKAGYLKSLSEIIHSDLFSDFLEMSQHLLSNGYKDAAAVIAGSTLENHLKQLALKFDVEVYNSNGKSKKADAVNADLVKAGAYGKLDQKNITAWLDLRNKAAHGDYSEYSKEEVKLFLENIRNFISRNPA